MRFVLPVIILFSFQAMAVQTLICTPTQNPEIQIEIKFHRDINPKVPFIGLLQFDDANEFTHYTGQLFINDFRHEILFQL